MNDSAPRQPWGRLTRRHLLYLAAGTTSSLAAMSTLSAAAQSTPVAAGEEIRIGAVTGNFSNPAVKQMVDAMEAELQNHPNVTFLVQDSANVQEQVAKAETMLAQGVQILGLHPWDGKLIFPALEKAKEQDVKVFLLIDDAPGAIDQGLATSFISANEREGGRLLGEWLANELPDGGKIAIVEGAPGNYAAIYRSEGFKQGIEANPNLQIVAEATGNWQRDQGLRVATDMITANPDLAAIFAHNDEMAFGALQALRAANKEGDVILIGYNGTCIGIEATLKDEFQADGILPIPQIGSEFIINAVKVANGESVPPTIEPPILALTTEEANAIASGDQEVDPALKARVDQAAAGECA